MLLTGMLQVGEGIQSTAQMFVNMRTPDRSVLEFPRNLLIGFKNMLQCRNKSGSRVIYSKHTCWPHIKSHKIKVCEGEFRQREIWFRMANAHCAMKKKSWQNEGINIDRWIIMSMSRWGKWVSNLVPRDTDMSLNPLEFTSSFRVFCRSSGINHFATQDWSLVGVPKSKWSRQWICKIHWSLRRCMEEKQL